MKDNMKKDKMLVWAFSVLKENCDDEVFGNITFSMQNGVIGTAKIEKNTKAPVDEPFKT